jgi:uncharacterized protein DUF1360
MASTQSASPVAEVRAAARQVEANYGRADHPLGGYLAIMATYVGLVGAGTGLLAKRGLLPERVGLGDTALLAVATHKLSRTIAKDSVASPLRAPFTKFEGPSGPGELNESVEGTGATKATGELITCPFCLDQWVATAFLAGLVLAPRVTRFVASTLAVRAGADFLQFGYAAAQHAAGS